MLPIECAGSPVQCGRAHGLKLREDVRANLARWLAARAEATDAASGAGVDLTLPHPYAAALLSATQHVDAMRVHCPDLLEELEGVAEGAGVAFENVLGYALMDEEWPFFNACKPAAAPVAVAVAPGCTVVSARTASDGLLLAQTMDLPKPFLGRSCVLDVRTEGGGAHHHRVMVLSMAGFPALLGVNARGLGVVVNNLSTLRASSRGLPVAAVVRGLLASCASVNEASVWLRQVPHATGQAYTLGDAAGARACFEASADGVTEVPGATLAVAFPPLEMRTGGGAAAPADDVRFCFWARANHPLASALPASESGLSSEALTEAAARVYATTATHARQAAAESALLMAASVAPSPPAATVLEAALAVPPVSVSAAAGAARGMATFAAAMLTCTVPPGMRVAQGPPHEHAFADVHLL